MKEKKTKNKTKPTNQIRTHPLSHLHPQSCCHTKSWPGHGSAPATAALLPPLGTWPSSKKKPKNPCASSRKAALQLKTYTSTCSMEKSKAPLEFGWVSSDAMALWHCTPGCAARGTVGGVLPQGSRAHSQGHFSA